MQVFSVESFDELNSQLYSEAVGRFKELEALEQPAVEGANKYHHCTDQFVHKGILDRTSIVEVLETVTRCRVIDPNMISFPNSFLEAIRILLPKEFVQASFIFPIKHENGLLHLVMANPLDRDLVTLVEVMTGSTVTKYAGSVDELRNAIDTIYLDDNDEDLSDAKHVEKKAMEAVSYYNNTANKDLEKLISDPYLIILFRMVLEGALAKSVSDLHFETQKEEFRVRVRQDGVLQTLWVFPVSLGFALIARMKVLAGLDMELRGAPQDGRISNNLVDGKLMDIRLSLLSGVYGEKVVLRVLERGKEQLGLTDLNLDEVATGRINKAISRPNGMILVTGPTGSGKTTTLYAILKELNSVDVNISTAEDPVEYELDGITQVSCTEQDETTFSDALKSFLRQDPDIIMVGEIRDSETADIATKAALTGHLMLSTLHTNDAASAITRLLNINVPDYVLAACNLTIVAQRLVRRICQSCKVSFVPPEKLIQKAGLKKSFFNDKEIFTGEGCPSCSGIGYRGRESVVEVLVLDAKIEELIASKASADQINKAAVQAGMKTMRESAIDKLLGGLTTLEEVVRVTADE